MRKNYFVFILLLYFLPLSAQEKLGIANSNYSSTNSIFLNPSSSVDSRTFVQANLLGLNIYGMNNAAYLPLFSVYSAAKGGFQAPQLSTINLDKFVYAKVEVDGPAVIISNREIGIGFFVRGRVEVDVRNIPKGLPNTLQNQNADTSLRHFDMLVNNAKMSEMAWVEYGLNFGKMIFKHGNILMSFGGNVKYLTGVNLAYANLASLNAHVDDTQAYIKNVDGSLRYNNPGWNTGQGGALDLGFTYKKTLKWVENYYSNSEKSSCKFIDYRYKIGVSLLDLGAIRFANNTFKGNISGATQLDMNTLKNINSIESLQTQIEKDFKIKEVFNSPIWASLPTALSIQADWNMTYYLHLKKNYHFYINTTAIQALTTAQVVGVQRSNLVSVAPRLEFKNFEIAMPLTFQRVLYPQLGFAFRIENFVFGLDNVLPLILRNDTYGGGFYFNIGMKFINKRCVVSRHRWDPRKTYAGFTFLSLKKNPKKSV